MLKTLLVLIGLLFTLNLVPATSYAAEEQDDCAPGYIIDFENRSCVRVSAESDPNNCAGAGGADAIEQCLAGINGPCNLSATFLGLPTWYKYLDSEQDATGRCSPKIDGPEDALPIGITVLEGALRLGGIVAVVMIFVGAFRFITSQGNPEDATAARKTIINSLVGLVIIIVSSSVVGFIGSRLG